MNQILITKKVYITPELKRKKKIYNFDFFLSIFLVCILISFCIYAEYDRNKGEEASQEILANMDIPQEDTTVAKNNVLVVVLDDEEQTNNINNPPSDTISRTKQKTNERIYIYNNSNNKYSKNKC